MAKGSGKALRIGELARRAGLSVRALRHYEQIGLLARPARTLAGQRLYGRDDLERLARIQALKALGLPLAEIAQALSGQALEPVQVLIERQLARIETGLAQAQALRARLRELSQLLRNTRSASSETLLQWMEVTAMFERYYTAEQLETLRQRKESLGEERIAAVQGEWPGLIEKVRAHLQAGDAPEGAEMVVLGRRWKQLVDAFTGGDPEIASRAREMYRAEPQKLGHFGLDPNLMCYVQKAIAAGQGAPG